MPSTSPRRAALVVNAKSRKGQEAFEEACRLLKEQGITLSSAEALADPKALPDAVKAAVASGAPMVIVGGGDGSMSSAVDHFVGRDTVFAMLPLGTANSFARTVGIPLDVAGAVGVIAGGRVKRIDLGMIDDDYFANVAAIGLSPLIAETVPHGLKKWLGRPGYLAWAAWQMTRFRPFCLKIGGERIEVLEVRIANGRFHGGAELVETEVDAGEIVVQAVVGRRRGTLLRSWGLTLFGPDKARCTLREFRGAEFRIATDPPLPISIDGEVQARTPATVRVARQAIRMVVPT